MSESLRIIGGDFRGRRLKYSGDPRTRPMKQRVREAAFNLIGPRVKGMLCLDLFGGTGALGLEALSRGAAEAVILERHLPTKKIIADNIATLEVGDRAQAVSSDTFFWVKTRLPTLSDALPWLVFCSPPFRFYQQRWADLEQAIERLQQAAPPLSLIVLECDTQFDLSQLPDSARWDARSYPPAVLAQWESSD